MQLTLTELFGFLGIVSSIMVAVWVISNRFAHLEVRVGRLDERVGRLEERVGRLEEKVDEILSFLKGKKAKRLHRKR